MNPVLSATDTFTATGPRRLSRVYAWAVFALTFGLMLSDYLSRQVIGAVIPAIKAEWALSYSQLGMLVSVVSLTVGLLACRSRWSPTAGAGCKSITLMAFVWCLATMPAAWRRATRSCCGPAPSSASVRRPTARLGRVAGPRVSGQAAGRGARRIPVGQPVRFGARRGPRRRRRGPVRLAHGVLRRRRAGPGAGVDLSLCRARLQDGRADPRRKGGRPRQAV